MKTLQNILNFGITGAGIGAVITTVSMLILGVKNCSVAEFAAWIIASVMIGVATMIMFSDKLKMPVATFIHFVLCFAIVTATAYICGYVDNYMTFLRIIGPMFILIYAIVYAAVYFAAKLNERAVNKALNEMKRKN